MRVLVTGSLGFVGRHLVVALRDRLPRVSSVVPTSQGCDSDAPLGDCRRLDVTDLATVERVIREVAPTHVVHLAGISAPCRVYENLVRAWATNVMGTLNVAQAILRELPDCRLIFASSGLIYGGSNEPGECFHEGSPLSPMNDYAATKAAADLALGSLALRGLHVIRLRPFNHTGVGQDEAFVLPGFAAQVARIEAGLQPPVIEVGNLDAVRDFLDVHDVVDAYVEAVLRANELPRGQVLNIASGVARRIGCILDDLLALSRVPITVRSRPITMQSIERPYSVGDASLARRMMNWTPVRDFEATLSDVLTYWRGQTAASVAKVEHRIMT
jgi:GDP-4-dehydro-6-deoxy-D-mannose reductase